MQQLAVQSLCLLTLHSGRTHRLFFLLAGCLLALICSLAPVAVVAQEASALPQFSSQYFSKIRLRVDSLTFDTERNWLLHQGEGALAFQYLTRAQTVLVDVFPAPGFEGDYLTLLPSRDFEVIDSAAFLEGTYFRFKLQYRNLAEAGSLSLIFSCAGKNGNPATTELRLLPWANVVVRWPDKVDEVYIGEGKVIELDCNYPSLVRADNLWQRTPDYDYKLMSEDRTLKLFLVPKESGKLNINIPISTRQARQQGFKATTDLTNLRAQVQVKSGRITFLGIDKQDVTLELDVTKPLEVQLDNHRNLQLKKTYRIENQSESGGPLIAELYTKSVLANEKVLCYLRPYALHRPADGILYIKDCDDTKFITNFSISERTQIRAVSILRAAGEWSPTLSATPGEQVEIRIEGVGLTKTNFRVEDVSDVKRDSIRYNENLVVLKFRVPENVSKRTLTIFAGKATSGYQLTIREFQEPRVLDFVNLSFGDINKPMNSIDKPILYDKPITDMSISFSPDMIDEIRKQYGKQYLEITVTYFNNRGEFVESKSLNNVVVCPGDFSPRALYYDRRDCNKNEIYINNLMTRKTLDLGDWFKIEVVVTHKASAYATTGFTKKAIIILQRHYTFDVDVSIPGGLLVRRVGVDGFGGFSGISLAIVPQFSFYRPDRIERLRPYKIGAGILALNAFNFSENATNRDVGIVVLGSVFPTKTGSKLSFPLYAGFGYFLQENRFFWLLGPGIGLRL